MCKRSTVYDIGDRLVSSCSIGSPAGRLLFCCIVGFICWIVGIRELNTPAPLGSVEVEVPVLEGVDMAFPACDAPTFPVKLLTPVLSLLLVTLGSVEIEVPVLEGVDIAFPACDAPMFPVKLLTPVLSLLLVTLGSVEVEVPVLEGVDMAFPACDAPMFPVKLLTPVLSLLLAVDASNTLLAVLVEVSESSTSILSVFGLRLWF